MIEQLNAHARKAAGELEAWRQAEHERIEEAVRARQSVLTSLRFLLIEDQRNPPRIGRPWKRPATAPARLRPARVQIPTAPHGPLPSHRPPTRDPGAG
jgi:hypothetical protein